MNISELGEEMKRKVIPGIEDSMCKSPEVHKTVHLESQNDKNSSYPEQQKWEVRLEKERQRDKVLKDLIKNLNLILEVLAATEGL